MKRNHDASAASLPPTEGTPLPEPDREAPGALLRGQGVLLVRHASLGHEAISLPTSVRAAREAPPVTDPAPVAPADEVAHVPLTDGEKSLLGFLVEQALKSWMPGT